MFSQRQLQQQLLQLQQMLQQQQQQQQQSLPPPPSRGTISSQQQQMLNLRPTGQASLLNANPMLQQALLIQQMQGNLRGFSMAAAPVLQQFFPQATRHSLLGPPPVGVSLKPTRLAFPNLPFQRQNRTFRKEFPKIAERKREADSAPGVDEAGLPVLEGSDMKTESYLRSTLPSETPIDPSADGEPEAKRLRSSKAEDSLPEEIICLEEAEGSDTTPLLGEAESKRTSPVVNSPEEKSFIDELKTSEVVNSAGSLKVTIQRSSESRAISTTALKPAHWTSETGVTETSPESALKFYCYICKTDYCNQQNFQSHMAGAEHQQRLQEIQRVSNICVVSLLPVGKEQRLVAEKDGETPRRWCNTCQVHFTGDLIQHRRTQEHKLAKRALCPVCTVCSRRFKTPRKFVEHMKSLEHKQKAKEVRLVEKEQVRPEDSEELITVDAVGCFEEEEEEDEEAGEGDDSDVEIQNKEFLIKQAEPKEILLEDSGDSEEYCPDTVYGPDFLVPVAGFLCRLCHKFYPSDSAGRLTHCKSLMHFENLQRYKAMKLQAAAIHPEASLDLQQQRPDAQQSTDAANMLDKSETDEFKAEDATLMGDCRSSIEESIPTAQTHSPAAFESCNWEAEDGSESGNRLEVGVLWKEAAGTGQASEPTGKPGFKPKPEVSPDEAEPAAANEASDSQELDPSSSPAKGDSSSGRRRYTRRRPR